ncbi:MAG TPA: hypothetical protein VLJ83_03795, partial [Gemmatimonadaceae bacterium]|nr:hypothetical protein [Gemmatimonadaceae bacterium]
MRPLKITVALAAGAVAIASGCTGTHEASAKSATPDLQLSPAQVTNGIATSTSESPSSTPAASTPGIAANGVSSAVDTDAVRPPVVVGNHPTPPVLDSLIKGTLPVRGLYVYRFGAN